jgi:pentose-5-phosphate-3-epimerase
MADYAVSAVCLAPHALADNVSVLADYPVEDLHCDVFPGRPGAPTMTPEQVHACMRCWPRTVTVHVWSGDPVAALRTLTPRDRDRVLVQDLPSIVDLPGSLDGLAALGWQVGLSLLPGAGYHRLALPGLSAAQLLTTSTPGYPGGHFRPAAYRDLVQLRRLRDDLGAEWSIEADGGVSEVVLRALDGLCDRLVLGTNQLTERGADGLRLPSIFLKGVPDEPGQLSGDHSRPRA